MAVKKKAIRGANDGEEVAMEEADANEESNSVDMSPKVSKDTNEESNKVKGNDNDDDEVEVGNKVREH